MTKPEIAKHLVQDVFMNNSRNNEKLENFGIRHLGDDFSEDSFDMTIIESTTLEHLGVIFTLDNIQFSSDIESRFSQYGLDPNDINDLMNEIIDKNEYASPHHMTLGEVIDAIYKKIHD